MSLKMEFVERRGRGESLAALCREFNVSRTTGHKWWKRFKAKGYAGLEEESRQPKSTPLATAEEIVLLVLKLRDEHRSWGPRTLVPLLRKRLGDRTPSERTVARILRRADRVRERRRRRPVSVVDRAPQVHAETPNEVWTVDFKGWWRTGDGQRCEPLTVRDAFSRYVLAVQICRSTASQVRAVFERLFRRHGIPAAIQCDNGVPFVAVRARGGLSKLSVWWMSLGIRLVRSRPGCPQDNGAHERMHADLRADVQSCPAESLADQQSALDRWRQQFNHVRAHQALGGKTPAEVYRPTERRKARLRLYEYPSHLRVVRTAVTGAVRWCGAYYFVGTALAGERVGMQSVDDMHVRIWFRDVDLGIIEVEPTVDDSLYELQDRPRKVKKTTKAA